MRGIVLDALKEPVARIGLPGPQQKLRTILIIMKARFSKFDPFLFVLCLTPLPLIAQAAFTDANWVSMGGLPGANGQINAVAADKNGNVYGGGNFTLIGTTLANNIAKWDGHNWSPLGSGLSGGNDTPVSALALDASGNLYAGGSFTSAGEVDASYIAKWDGSNWSALGEGLAYPVGALACDSFGNLYAGGYFAAPEGEMVGNYVAQWDGANWSALGSAVGGVLALACDTKGNLYAGGVTTAIFAGTGATIIAKWDGSDWSAFGSGAVGYDWVSALACDADGNLYAGGSFTMSTASGESATNIAKWDGSTWSALGSGVGGTNSVDSVNALAIDSSGNLYAGGDFGVESEPGANFPSNYIAKWNGSAWSVVGAGVDDGVNALACDGSGNLYAGGNFSTASGIGASCVAKWGGSAWSALISAIPSAIPSVNGSVNALAFDTNGILYVGGQFSSAGMVAANNIAKWNGMAWSALGSGISGVNAWWSSIPYVTALAFDSSGNLYAAGLFPTAGGISAANTAKWNGSAWSSLGPGIGTNVYVAALACDTRGNIYAGGWFQPANAPAQGIVAQWTGGSWAFLGSGMRNSGDYAGFVNCLACDRSGNVYAGGQFTSAGGVNVMGIARWDGGAWSAVGSGVDGDVDALAFDANGNLYAGGVFSTAGGVNATNIAEWDGSAWSAVGSGVNSYVSALVCDSAGNLYAGGPFSAGNPYPGGPFTTTGVSANSVAKWDGSTWSALGSGINATGLGSGAPVSALALDSYGSLWVGGNFTTAGTNISVSLAKALLRGPTPNQLLLASAGGETNVTTYLGIPGANYALDLAASLAPPVNWMPQATNMASTNNAAIAGYLTLTNLSAAPQGFYRMRLAQ
jgi:hypothetical protein